MRHGQPSGVVRLVATLAIGAIVAVGCSSSDGDLVAETSSTTTEAVAASNTAEPSGAGDSIALCSLAADTTRAGDADAVVATLESMVTVAPTELVDELELVVEGWTSGEPVDGVADAAAVLEAHVLEECGVVVALAPQTP